MQLRYFPPTRRSIVQYGVVNVLGPHHFLTSSGSVHALQTALRGASNTRTIVSPRSVASPFGEPGFSPPRSSARRSHVSDAPSAIPASNIPLKSSTDSKREVTVTLVPRACFSNVAVSTTTRPGIPSNSNVETIRSGGTISLYTPWNANSLPSAPREMYRQAPPGRTSILSTIVVYRRGPHQYGIDFGSAYAVNTRSRGASNTRVITISRSDCTANAFSPIFHFFRSIVPPPFVVPSCFLAVMDPSPGAWQDGRSGPPIGRGTS